MNIGPYEGKQTGESALLRGILDCLHPGDVAVFDRIFCFFLMLAILRMRGVHFCTRLHQRRPVDFCKGRRLGPDDMLVTWIRPKRPAWMSEDLYAQIPETMTLRQVRFQVTEPGKRTEELVVVTITYDYASRLSSYELLAKAFGLDAVAPGPRPVLVEGRTQGSA